MKAHAIFYLLELEKQGKITRDDGYQGILNAIASDVRSKHRKRLDRRQEKEYMKGALKQLSERKKFFEEKIESYNAFVDGAMNTMQRGNQKWVFCSDIPHTFSLALFAGNGSRFLLPSSQTTFETSNVRAGFPSSAPSSTAPGLGMTRAS